MSVMENLNMLNAQRNGRTGWLDWKKLRDIARKYKESLNIRVSNINLPVQTLSGGNQQKAALGKWLDMDPQIILFDEPTRGIDIGAKSEIYKIMGRLVKRGASIIMVSSELPELISVADHILIMQEGRMKGILGRDEVTQEKVMGLAAQKSAQ